MITSHLNNLGEGNIHELCSYHIPLPMSFVSLSRIRGSEPKVLPPLKVSQCLTNYTVTLWVFITIYCYNFFFKNKLFKLLMSLGCKYNKLEFGI